MYIIIFIFSTPLLNLTITFQPLSMFKWQMYSAQQLRNRFNVLGNLMGEEEDDQDQDSVKEAFLETNIYLLVCTFVISIVHSVFEFLAFKNDIQFWKERKTTEGLSVRLVLVVFTASKRLSVSGLFSLMCSRT